MHGCRIILYCCTIAVLQPEAFSKEITVSSLELQFSTKLSSTIRFHLAEAHVLPTNVNQLIRFMTTEGWASLEDRFKHFGEQAGFSNSIFEKYVFLPAGVTFPVGPSAAEAILLNAHSIQDKNGERYRWVIYRIGEAVDHTVLTEDKVQEIITRAGVAIPKPAPMISAIELDTPRRQEEAQRQQEMETEIQKFMADQEPGKASPRSPTVRIPPSSTEESKDTKGDVLPEPSPSRPRYFGVGLVLFVGFAFTIFVFRQGRQGNGGRK